MASAYDLWKQDKLQRDQQAQQDAQNGTVNFKEASTASRPQYTNPVISQQDPTGQNGYQWQKDILGNLTGKGIGRSNNDKFNYLTSQLGMTPGQANDFRNFLNFQENSQKQIKLSKTGKVGNSSVPLGSGDQTQNGLMDNILNNMTNRGVASVNAAQQADDQIAADNAKLAAQQQAMKQSLAQKPQSSGNPIYDYLRNAVDTIGALGERADNQFMKTLFPNLTTKADAQQQQLLTSGNPQNQTAAWLLGLKNQDPSSAANVAQAKMFQAARTEANTPIEKAANLAGGFAGNMAPYVVGDGLLGLAGKALPSAVKGAEILNNPVIKAALHGTASGATGSALDVAAKAGIDGDKIDPKQAAEYVALNALAGGATGGLIGGVKPLLDSQLHGLVNDLKKSGYSQYSDAALTQAVKDAYAPKGDVSNVLADPAKAPMPEPFIPKYGNVNAKVDTPTAKTQEDPAAILDQIKQAQDLRKQHEDAYVQDAMAPIHETQQKQAQAEQTWQTTIKQAKETAQRIKDTYGKIYVPKTPGQTTDIQDMVPAQFRSGSKASGTKAPYDIYKFAEDEGFSSPEEAVKFLQELDQSSKTRLKDLMPSDSKVYTDKQLKELEQAHRENFAGSSHGQAIDKLINDLTAIHKEATAGPNPLSDRLASLVGKPAQKEAAATAEKVQPTTPNAAPPVEEPKQKLRMNLQHFDNEEIPNMISSDKPIESKSPIDMIQNPVKKAVAKANEAIASNTHQVQVAHELALQDRITRLEQDGNAPKKVEQLKGMLKEIKKSGSPANQAIQNEDAIANLSRNFSEKHLKAIQDALGTKDEKALSDAMHYQIAKNVDWVRKNVNPDYTLGKDANGNEIWDQGRINALINKENTTGGDKLKAFNQAFRNWSKERLDLALKHGDINQNQYDALMRNPHYIPMANEVSAQLDNVARGKMQGGSKLPYETARTSFIKSLDSGSANNLIKNPLDVMVQGDYNLHKNIARGETLRQLYDIGKLNKGAGLDNTVVKIVPKSQAAGGYEVPLLNGKKAYIKVQDEIKKVLDEAQLPSDLGTLGKVTSLFAQLKTRSFAFQTTNGIRDVFLDGPLKSRADLRYGTELIHALLTKNAAAKEAGATFDHAYKQGMGEFNHEKLMQQFIRDNKAKQISLAHKTGIAQAGSLIKKIWDLPAKLGQLTDELPRSVEVQDTQRRYMKANGDQIKKLQTLKDGLEERIANATEAAKNDPFAPEVKGVDKLKAQLTKVNTALNKHDIAMKREMTYRGRDMMNFKRSGRSDWTKRVNALAIFARTTTQAKDKFLRTLKERPVQTLTKAALLVAPFAGAEAINRQTMSDSDKKTFDNIPYYVRQNNWVYVMNGQVVTIPKQQELSIFTNPIEHALYGDSQGVNDSLRTAVKEAVPGQMGNIVQGFVPNKDGSMTPIQNMNNPGTIAAPLLDAIANSKMGLNHNPISNAAHFNKKDAKANSYTLDVYKKLLGDKPNADFAQYLTGQYGGDYGNALNYLADLTTNPHDQSKINAVIQNLEPLQKHVYSSNNPYFKSIPHKSKATGK